MSMNKFKPIDTNNLNPVITKKKESDDIKLLRESFSRNFMNASSTKIKRHKSSDKSFENLSLKFRKLIIIIGQEWEKYLLKDLILINMIKIKQIKKINF